MADWLRYMEAGRQQRAQNMAMQQQQQLNELSRLAIAKPSQREAIAAQIATIDPQAGFALAQQAQEQRMAEQEAAVADQEKRRGQAANFARYLSGIRSPEARQRIAQMYAPKFGDQFPQDLSDEGLGAFAAMAGQQGESFRPMVVAPGSALVGPDGNVVFQNPARESTPPIVRVPDGRGGEIAGYNTPQGFVPLGGGSAAPSLPYRVDLRGMQPESIAQTRALIEQDAGRQFSDAEWAQISGQQPQGGGIGYKPPPQPRQFTRLTPQEVSAAGYPQGTIVQRDSATGEERVTRQVDAATLKEQAAARAKAPRIAAVVRSLDDINRAMGDIQQGRVGLGLADTGPIDQFVSRFSEEGDRLNKAVQRLSSDLLALTRVPGVGSQSDLEARLDQLRYPSLGSFPAANREALAALGAFIKDLADAYEVVGDETTAATIRRTRPQLEQILGQIEGVQQGQPQQGGRYQVGQIIEIGGKRYRVTGGDPNDPDVEEVR